MLIAFYEVRNLAICRYKNQPDMSSSSTSRRPRLLTSPSLQHCSPALRRLLSKTSTSGYGTFETCQPTLMMSVHRGRPEVSHRPTVKAALWTHLGHRPTSNVAVAKPVSALSKHSFQAIRC